MIIKYEIFYQGKPGTGKVKEDAKSDNENEEDNKLKDEDLDKTKKEDTPAKVCSSSATTLIYLNSNSPFPF